MSHSPTVQRLLGETAQPSDSPTVRLTTPLRGYFYSGWMFLIPYSLIYLLYQWLELPVNPISQIERDSGYFTHLRIPLLYVFWGLHFVHLILVIAVPAISWIAAKKGRTQITLDSVWAVVPWLLLALLLWLPGAYLEFPADPWEHIGRINEWNWANDIAGHSWPKLSYFLAYSTLPRPLPGAGTALGAYTTTMGFILCWNSFTLALEFGLRRPFAFLFAVVQPLVLGNNAFSFLQYYSLAPSLLALIGTTALLRTLCILVRNPKFYFSCRWRTVCRITGIIILVALIVQSHLQGAVAIFLQLGALLAWHCVSAPRRVQLIAFVLVAASAILTILVVSRAAIIGESFRADGWISNWYGFNILSLSSPAAIKAVEILGFFGIINLTAGIFLVCRRELAGFVTVIPVLILLHPAFAIPIATLLAEHSASYIFMFNRFLFAVPAVLALSAFADWLCSRACDMPGIRSRPPRLAALPASLFLFGLLTVPATAPFFNRLWSAWHHTPADLTFSRSAFGFYPTEAAALGSNRMLVSSAGLSCMILSQTNMMSVHGYRGYHRLYHFPAFRSPAKDIEVATAALRSELLQPTTALVIVPMSKQFYTPWSTAALLSNHWLPIEAALSAVGSDELLLAASRLGWKEISSGNVATRMLEAPSAPQN